jgi:hypothetical protein
MSQPIRKQRECRKFYFPISSDVMVLSDKAFIILAQQVIRTVEEKFWYLTAE